MSTASKIVVAIPALNEADHIERAIKALLTQDQLANDCRVIVLDGGSRDNTRELVLALSKQFPNLELRHNSRKTQAHAMNMLLNDDFAEVDTIIRCDAHADYPKNFVSDLINCLNDTGAASVVIPMDAVAAQGCFQKGLAWIADSKLGSGGSPHRGGQTSGYVDHGHHAAFRMEVFRRLGGYDTDFVANEDAEYDRRLHDAGERIWLNADIRIGYYPRTSMQKLAKQYYNYGKGRAQTCHKHRLWPGLRQLIPVLHTLLIVLSLIMLAASLWPGWVWPMFYTCLVAGAGIHQALKHRSICGLTGSIALAIMHTAWGCGFLIMLARQTLIRRQST